MTANAYLQIALYLLALGLLAWPLGLYMARIYNGDIPVVVRGLRPLENGLYRLSGVKPDDSMSWLPMHWPS